MGGVAVTADEAGQIEKEIEKETKTKVEREPNMDERLKRLYQIKEYFESLGIPLEKPHESRFYVGFSHGRRRGRPDGLPSGRLGFVIAINGGDVTCNWQNGGDKVNYDSDWFNEKMKIIIKKYPELAEKISIRKPTGSRYIFMDIKVDQKKLPDDLLAIFDKTKEIMRPGP
jgi:hypothetical protein